MQMSVSAMKNNSLKTQDRRAERRLRSMTRLRLRISRFLTDRYLYREHPAYFPELLVFAIFWAAATALPIVSLAVVFATLK